MGDYSSFYKYEKFEVVGDELISLGIFSIDADGTMPLVVKDDCDPQCGCPQPIYQWIQTEDTVCIEVLTRTTTGTPYCSGDDLYADVTVEESIDDGDTWEVVSTTPTLVEVGGCASPEVQYRWVAIGTTCSNGNKYQNNVKQVSTDGGHTWTDVVPAEYSASTLIESDSYDCGYRTSATTSATYCSNANQYVDVYSLVSRDYGVTWSTASTSTELVDSDVYECGYRTSTTSSSTYCNGDDLYVDVYYRVSRDYGTTWVTASTAITMVESGSSQCHQTVHVTGVTLNKNSMSLNSGSSETLIATVSPSNADDKSVTWSSNNTSVATVNSSGLVSGVTSGSATITVTTTDGGYTAQCSVSVSGTTPPIPSHEYVDLGLPSGTLWAKTNIGASSETDYGNYYQYGKGADDYSVTSGQSDYSGTEDPLASSADTAVQVWGGQWHMPTQAQLNELTANTTYSWETDFNNSGINGGKFTAQNGNYVFFPAGGSFNFGIPLSVGFRGYCWGSTPGDSNFAYSLTVSSSSETALVTTSTLNFGFPIRPVMDN